ncbi:MAG: VOC family protein, partial [Planctomycetaceae bacterium]
MPSPPPPPTPSGPAAEFFAAEVRTAAWEALVAWYREVLGLRVLLRVSDDGYALLGDARGRIAIVSRPDPGPAGERIGLAIEVVVKAHPIPCAERPSLTGAVYTTYSISSMP